MYLVYQKEVIIGREADLDRKLNPSFGSFEF